MELTGKVALITGASSGIGAATARELARRGVAVALAARRASELDALAAEIEQAGGRALAVPTDLTRRDEIDRLVARTVDAFGRVDLLVNNAGISGGSSIAESEDAAMERIVNVNLLAPARCIQAVLPHMREQGGGMIVNIGSVSGEVAINGLYSATKFGLRGLSDAARRELRRDNIDVALVAPGFIRTAMTAGLRLPMPGPEAVALAVVGVIQRPRRRVVVPWPYLPVMYVAKLLPWLVDWVIGSERYQRHSSGRKRTM